MVQRSRSKQKETSINKSELTIGLIAAAVIAVIVGGIVFFSYASKPNVVYQPSVACALVTQAEVTELLGERVINSTQSSPVISENTATSRCGYTDGNSNLEKMVVAAIVVRSGINDEGVALNKTEFAESKADRETIKDLGDDAFYNEELGQLNVLDGYKWMILSYGVGSTPEKNKLQDSINLAKIALN